MKWKLSLASIILAFGVNTCAINQHQQPNGKVVEPVRLYENNNLSLEDKVISKVAKSVEMIEVSDLKAGSGVILSEKDGFYYVLTAHHLVDLSGMATLTSKSSTSAPSYLLPSDKTKIPLHIKISGLNDDAQVICSSKALDYALLKVESDQSLFPLSKNQYAALGNSDLLEIGDYTYALGYPLMTGLNVTDGIISSINVPLISFNGITVEENKGFRFHNSISPGNSGGPVFTVAKGKLYLIGVISGYFTDGNDLNVAFKINPIIDDAKRCNLNLPELMNYEQLDDQKEKK